MRWMVVIALGMLACNPPIQTCDDGVGCEDCLAIDGCSYSADQCRTTCVQDAACFGPANPDAPTCPDEDDTSDSGA